MGDRQHAWGLRARSLWATAAVALALAGCTDDEPTAADPTTSTSSTAPESFACDGSPADPVPLDAVAAGGTVVEIVARPSGQLVAIGTSVWIRDPGEETWRSTPKPGGPDDQVSAVAEHDDSVWAVTNYFADVAGQSRMFRSTDLTTWTEVPFLQDGATTPAAVQALVHDGDRWLGLAQADSEFQVISSPDGEAWTTEATTATRIDGTTTRALFDLLPLEDVPTSVGFTVGGPTLRPLEVEWSGDGSATDRSPEGDDLDEVRSWAMTALADGRVLVVADRVVLGPGNEPIGFTPLLAERSDTGALDVLGQLPAPTPFAAPADAVEVGDGKIVVVGTVGDTRQSMSPGAWTVCVP